jgi:hypothetical protein
MNISTIYKLQREHGLDDVQEMINTGDAWRMDGEYGRWAMSLLRSGACMLPKDPAVDAYGNRVPSRDEVVSGTLGSFENAVNFWSDDENLMALEFQGLLDEEDEEDEEVYLFEHY